MFNFDPSMVTKTYNGAVGCMCGCKGNYSEPNTAATARRVKKIMSFVGPVRPNAADSGDQVSYSTEPFGDECYVYVEENGRNTTVYFHPHRAP